MKVWGGEVMRNTKTLGIGVALGLGLIFSSPFAAWAQSGGEPMTGGIPDLEDRVTADEALIAELETDVTTLETLGATALHRLSAEFQNEAPGSVGGEVTTSAGVPGIVVYDKTLSIPFPVAYITFSAQGDTHGGAGLLMTAAGTTAVRTRATCQPIDTPRGAPLIAAQPV